MAAAPSARTGDTERPSLNEPPNRTAKGADPSPQNLAHVSLAAPPYRDGGTVFCCRGARQKEAETIRPSIAFLNLAGLLSLSLLVAQDQVRWSRSSAPDGSLSLQQPEGWTAKFGANNVRLANAARDEEIIVIRLPRDPSKSASVYAEAVARSFQQSLASFQMTNLTTAQDTAAFAVKYNSAGKSYTGTGVVVLKPSAAWWVGYGSPSAADLARGAALITGVARSVSDGSGQASAIPSSPPAVSSAATASSGGSPLVGDWSTTGYYGELVNPANGSFVVSSYSGEWYRFGADGTYRYTIAGSGQIIVGVVICNGTYETKGNTLLLHQKTESWYPLPRDPTRKPMYRDRPTPAEKTLRVEPKGPGEIVIREGTSASTFHRDPQSR